MSTTTSGQFLTVPALSHRPSHHHRRDSARASAQSPQPRGARQATGNVASSSRVRLEDTPLGMPVSPSPSPADAAPPRTSSSSSSSASVHTSTTTATSESSAPALASSPTPEVRQRQRQQKQQQQQQQQQQTVVARLVAPGGQAPSNNVLPAMASHPTSSSSARSLSSQQQQQQPSSSQPPPPPPPQLQHLSPRSIFRAMPFLLRLRSPPSDLLNMTCTSGGPRTHAVFNRPPISINKASSQAMVYNQSLVCEDAVNAEVLLRLARNELLERAQQTDRRVTALVEEEYVPSFCFSFQSKERKESQHER